MSNTSDTLARRAFLQRLGHLGVAGVATPWALNLAAMSDAAAQTGGYKALVCVFLLGGNDNGNTVIPYDSTGHSAYVNARGGLIAASGSDGLAIARDQIIPLNGTGLSGSQQWGLPRELSGLANLFHSGKLAVQMNVGPLIRPTTLDDYKARTSLPPKLFSHNDQQSIWQSSRAEGSVQGWGGTLGDLTLGSNGRSAFTCMSVAGNAVFLSGATALQYQIGTNGAIAISPITNRGSMFNSDACSNALRTLMTEVRSNLLEHELNTIVQRSWSNQATLSSAIASSATQFDSMLPDSPTLSVNGSNVAFTNLRLNRQLKMVARIIEARERLGMQRQVFMVTLGGFDNHDRLYANHASLLAQVNAALVGFQAAMESIGAGDIVTTFTASDFGRTITSNGDGSDHGWGGHHFVMGGAVKGKAFYGTPPSAIMGGAEDVGNGRYIPSTSVDQYAATMAKWFGVPDAQMAMIAPNLANFSTRDLGFMR
ncbi:MAG: DUF1501 domain-containing protein [Pseudomonadota bacterium]|nr:DUF1501 domain-containing protein [Pseudomonadota bacterium]